jgi:esterase/lipase superfamily enzyme
MTSERQSSIHIEFYKLLRQAKQAHNRYRRTGDLKDLDEVIRLLRDAVDHMPADFPDQLGLLYNLGAGLRDRYERTGRYKDLEEATVLFKQGNKSTNKRLKHFKVEDWEDFMNMSVAQACLWVGTIEGTEYPESSDEAGAYAKFPYAVVKVFYATDRNLTNSSKPSGMYGSNRAPVTYYGTCEVSIPRDHRMGELESPSILRFEFREDPKKHVVLLKVSVYDKSKYFTEIAGRIHESSSNSAFLFVHGYNVTFEEAARRTAQISYDLGFDGAPVFYSWPSQGTVPGYPVDETNVNWSKTNIKHFLEDFVTRSDAQNIYLIAHSMGNRALTLALGSLFSERSDLRQRFQEIILTAPDIDAEVFKRDIAPKIVGTKPCVTLYASSEDKALLASKKFHGYPRAGDAESGLVIVPGIETIDATDVDTSFLGHSYFAETKSVLADMFYLIHGGVRANQRFSLMPVEISTGRYWKFKK